MARPRPASLRSATKAAEGYGKPGEPNWREIDWTEHLHQSEIDSRSVNYCDYGEGPAVLMIHGLGGSWQNWLENIRAVGQTHRVIAPDLPGFGFSEMPREKTSIQGFGRTVAALCEQLGIDRVEAVIGNSMGGFVSAELALQRPDLVERVVLVSAAGIGVHKMRREPVVVWGRTNTAIATRLAANTETGVRRPRLRHLIFSTLVRHPTRVPQDMLYELAYYSGRDGFMPALYAHFDYDFRDRLEEIECPVLIVWGADDMVVWARDADEYEQVIPNARKVIFEDTGHLPMVERAPEFNALIEDFLAGRDAEVPQLESVP
ncbi:MAG: alpha/beta fold hydrolase [Thermoleophilaceae bacterium]|jgi:pimeloyl-ACP methyl ester carboxylesterase